MAGITKFIPVVCIIWIKCALCQIHTVYEIKDPTLLDNDTAVAIATGTNDFYDYELEKINYKPVISVCYTCHYTQKDWYDFGMANCDEPFDYRGIPVVSCEGYCAVTKSILGYEQYMIVRSCLPNCKNIYDEGTSVQCCFGNLCNGAQNGSTMFVAEWNFMIVALIVAMSVLMK